MLTAIVPAYLDDCQRRKIIFLTGKGGVGKTTLAWATAEALRRRGARVAVASWNPFEESTPPAGEVAAGIEWLPLDTLSAFRDYILHLLKFEKLYDSVLDNRVMRAFVLAAPGLSETVIAGKIWDRIEHNRQDVLLVDLPSSGHAVSFFQSPNGVRQIFPVGFVHRETQKVLEMFKAPWARVDLVTLPEELPVIECLELKRKLEDLCPLNFGYTVVNQLTPDFPLPDERARRTLPTDASACLRRHESRRRQEEEAVADLAAAALPLVRLPRVDVAHRQQAITRLADLLGGAG